jgi:alpha-ketoglutarate-dependent taurine dioxygenase
MLFRGFGLEDPADFSRAARSVSSDLLGYLERAAPRTEVADKVFTSTEFAHDQWIPFHHEMSYSHNWPSLLYFYCHVPPEEGGATPLSSERKVISKIPSDIREKFTSLGVRYIRNYGPYVDLSWQEAFQTTDRAEVERYCRDCDMDFIWTGDGGLRTISVRQAVCEHPDTGQQVWFNHAHMFHVSNLPAEVAATLLAEFGPEGMPRNSFYGDGTSIEDEVIALINRLYSDAAVSYRWERGDLLIVDNFLATHGREPFRGARRILVAMSDLHVSRWMADRDQLPDEGRS